jgi:hypothetical protein
VAYHTHKCTHERVNSYWPYIGISITFIIPRNKIGQYIYWRNELENHRGYQEEGDHGEGGGPETTVEVSGVVGSKAHPAKTGFASPAGHVVAT